MAIPVRSGVLPRFGAAFAIAIVLVISPIAQADIVIDDFSAVGTPDPWPVIRDTPGFVDVTEAGTGAGINGNRLSRIVAASLDGAGDQIEVNLDTSAPGMNSNGAISFMSTAGAQGALALIYDGGGLGIDLSTELGLLIDFESAEWTTDQIRVTLTLVDGDGLLATGRQDLVETGAQTQFIAFNDLDFINLVNLAAIQRIEVALDGQEAGSSFSVSQIYTTDIPAPGAVLALALFGLTAHRRRRRAG